MRKTLALLLTALLTGACSSIDCPLENTVNLVCGFYKADGTPDTTLINRDVRATGFKLPISSGAAADTFLIMLTDTLHRQSANRIIVNKTDLPHFESVDCKMSYFHTINDVTWSGPRIDSVTVTKQQVDYDASAQHLHIYFKAQP